MNSSYFSADYLSKDLLIEICINHVTPCLHFRHFSVCPSGGALLDIGETMKRMAEVKDSLDIDVKQNFIDPLQAVADKDIKDIQVDPVNSSVFNFY